MAAISIPYSKQMLAQRIRKHVNQGFITDDFSTSDNELYLYIDQALAAQIRLAAYENAKVEGVLMMPEGFLMTFQLTGLVQDANTRYWSTTLPQPPISLPLGYGITHVYFTGPGFGRSIDATPIKNKRLGYRWFLPTPPAIYYWVENNTLWLYPSNGYTLQGQTVFVQMPSTRTTDPTLPMNIPDDVLEAIFNDVVTQLIKRMSIPKDIVKDNLPSGSTNINSTSTPKA